MSTTTIPTIRTTTRDAQLHSTPNHMVMRGAGAVLFASVALVHLLDLPGKMHEVPYMGFMYVGLVLGSVFAAVDLIDGNVRRGWLVGGGLALATIAGYAINRTIGMPNATEDIGNWFEPLGLASLFIEALAVMLSVRALRALARQ